MITFEESKKILNTDNVLYTDEEIKLIVQFITLWARINAKAIINKTLKRPKKTHEKSGDNGPGEFG